MKTIIKTVCCILIFDLSALAANFSVKSSGGGDFTTIQSCASAMSPGDTCTVYAGTYNESVSVPAGTAGNYKTVTVNGSDVVTVTGSITMGSHTKVNGFASTGCFATGASTDAYITHNQILSGCNGTKIEVAAGATYIYIQGNTLAGPCGACDGIRVQGSHVLIDGNDISRYRLGVNCYCSYTITRNNTFHDQYETDSGEHTDAWFSEPDSSHVQAAHYNVIEGNYHTNAVGPNAKGFLFQGDACGGNCSNAIVRFNSAYLIDGTYTTNDLTTFNYVKEYNNTWVNTRVDGYNGYFTDYYVNTNASDLNSIFYYPAAVNGLNPYACDGSVCSSMNYGHALAYCTGGCGNLGGHLYGSYGNWTSDPGNVIADPLFVNYSTQNFHLQSGSPAIGAGTSLTTANGSGSNRTSLVVNDASYFQDGYGLANPTVQADCISITTVTNHVCITAVNYSTNTLTLASPISWSNGDSVWLYSKSDSVQVLTGSAPDVGAYPYGSGGGSAPAPPSGLSAVVN